MTAPSHPTDAPTPEAREAARSALLEIGCCLYGRPSPTTEIARALDAFAAAKVEREREKIIVNLREAAAHYGRSGYGDALSSFADDMEDVS